MAWLKRGSRGWQYLTLAIIVVPWFLRDQLASMLETRTQAAQQVLSALDAEQQRQQTDRDQRANGKRLLDIEILVKKIAHETTSSEAQDEQTKAWDESVKSDGAALAESVASFEELLKTAAIGEAAKAPLFAAAQEAHKGAEALEQQYGQGDDKQDEALVKAFDEGALKLEGAYQALYKESARQADSSSTWASTARIIAWLLTALGAFMMGDWARLVGGQSDPDDNAADDAPDHEA